MDTRYPWCEIIPVSAGSPGPQRYCYDGWLCSPSPRLPTCRRRAVGGIHP